MKNQIQTRHATENDVTELCLILNEIIEIGGTTAYETNLNESEFSEHFLSGEHCIVCIVAHSGDLTLGFQSLSIRPDLPNNWTDIATFSRSNSTVKGVGTALFTATKYYLSARKYTHINASIRADNRAGLAYYSKMGFEDYSIRRGIPLKDGTPIDRVSKQFLIQ